MQKGKTREGAFNKLGLNFLRDKLAKYFNCKHYLLVKNLFRMELSLAYLLCAKNPAQLGMIIKDGRGNQSNPLDMQMLIPSYKEFNHYLVS